MWHLGEACFIFKGANKSKVKNEKGCVTQTVKELSGLLVSYTIVLKIKLLLGANKNTF